MYAGIRFLTLKIYQIKMGLHSVRELYRILDPIAE